MSYELYLTGKPQGQVASLGGMEPLSRKYSGQDNELGRFLRNGSSRRPGALAEAIRKALSGETVPELVEILRGILRKLPEEGTVSLSGE